MHRQQAIPAALTHTPRTPHMLVVVIVVSELHGPRRTAASGARTARGKKPP
jgi:hypothetical protein